MTRFYSKGIHFTSAVIVGFLAAMIVVSWPTLGHGKEPANKTKPSYPWMNRDLSPDQRTELVLKEMTLDEKIVLVHGILVHKGRGPKPRNYLHGGAGYVAGIARLGIPDVQMTNGRSGVGQAGKLGRYATALPSALALSASWDTDLAHEYGKLMGKECRQLGFQVSLGATANLVREARNGRNFECLGEDPILIGKMLAAQIRGTQAEGVIANLNRYAVNDHENHRHKYNIVMNERTMRETDLLAFEIIVKESGVGSVMGAYNRLNGIYCCENDYLLNEVLKKEWGFTGWVMSDWSGTHSDVKAALAGLDQEMPASKYFGVRLKQAVEKGQVPMARLDDMVHRILRTEFALGVLDDRKPGEFPPVCVVDPFTGAELAQRVAEQSIVLLKNAGELLPLDSSHTASIAVIGSHADVGVLSGWGSDQVDPAGGNPISHEQAHWRTMLGKNLQMAWHPSSPLKAIRAIALGTTVRYDSGTDVAAAARLASSSTVAIVFAHQYGHESADVPDLSLPEEQDKLIEAVAAANPRTIVVLETCGPVTMPWIDKVSAVVEAWYPGIRGGEAIANILFGRVNPSAKLTVTFPRREADLPRVTFPSITRKNVTLSYQEGLKAGYKWYDAEGKTPLFPFGFGLSYTTFAYSDLKTTVGKEVRVSFKVTNTGRRAGDEIAQVYATLPAAAEEPFKRLVAWKKIHLESAETKTVSLSIDPLHLSIFDVDNHRWKLPVGNYTIFVGGSSHDMPLQATISLDR